MAEKSAKNVLEPYAWLLQIITGLAMVGLVTFHFLTTHMVEHALSFESVSLRFQDYGYKIIYALLLIFVAFHAFNGLRAIALDTEFGMKRKKLVNWSMVVVFLAALIVGLYIMFLF
ncbi:MAG: succinate dehydrogenase [Archaeoglobales archaeon]|nr:succinate dehydrogenase [Archaeoglobales archaeon]